VGCAPVCLDVRDVGEHEQRVGFELGGQQSGREVLTDDGLDAAQPVVFVEHDRDPAAANADDEYAGADK
jgi:hypothetical protein